MTPNDVVNKMLETDAFSNWLGIKVIDLKKALVKLP